MTIKTLEYIHNLLVIQEKRTDDNYQRASSMLREYEGRAEPDEELVAAQKVDVDFFMRAHIDALSALNEFEAADW